MNTFLTYDFRVILQKVRFVTGLRECDGLPDSVASNVHPKA